MDAVYIVEREFLSEFSAEELIGRIIKKYLKSYGEDTKKIEK